MLSEYSPSDDEKSAAVISGPTTTLERIRVEEPELDFRYLVYKRQS